MVVHWEGGGKVHVFLHPNIVVMKTEVSNDLSPVVRKPAFLHMRKQRHRSASR